MSTVTEIDGSLLEGGGQILRIALTMSVLMRKPVRIKNIRAGRSKPGLMEQHLKGVQLVRDISRAEVKGTEIGSTELEFHPTTIVGGSYTAAVRTAGSISLLLQVALPCTLFANSKSILTLQGGTNAEMAPQIDYTTEVFQPVLEKFGATFDFCLRRRGYFPKGGGEVVITVNNPPRRLQAVEMTTQGVVTDVYGWSFVAGTLPIRLAHMMADSAVSVLKTLHNNVGIQRYKEKPEIATGNCSGIILVAQTSTGCILGGSALGKREERPEEVGKRAAEELLNAIREGGCVDKHTQDQVIVFMALAEGQSRIKTGELTLHTKTAMYVTEQLTNVKFETIREGNTNILQCDGLGLRL